MYLRNRGSGTDKLFFISLLASLLFLGGPIYLSWSAGAQENRNEEFDEVVTIGVRPGQMRYDVEEFSVPAGGRIKLIFDNTDGTLQHNVLILTPGDENFAIELAREAWSMTNPIENEYVPDSEDVLFSTELLQAGEKDTITFTAPEKPGDHPYVCTVPGHAMSMNGMMHVTEPEDGTSSETSESETEEVVLSDLSRRSYEETGSALPDFDSREPMEQSDLPAGKLSVEPQGQDTPNGWVFHGTLRVPNAGVYLFGMHAAGATELLINDETVISPDQREGFTALKKVELEPGDHSFRIAYGRSSSDAALQLAVISSDGAYHRLSEQELDGDLKRALVPGRSDSPLLRIGKPDQVPDVTSVSYDEQDGSTVVTYKVDGLSVRQTVEVLDNGTKLRLNYTFEEPLQKPAFLDLKPDRVASVSNEGEITDSFLKFSPSASFSVTFHLH